MFISFKMSNKKKNKHSTDDLKGLCIYFDGICENPLITKMQPYIFAFGGRIFTRLDERVNCLVVGKNPKIKKGEISKFPNLKIMDYQTFLDSYFKSSHYW